MKTTIVGGTWYSRTYKVIGESKIIQALSKNFKDVSVTNGGFTGNLPKKVGEGLTIWMPNISNDKLKYYPKKEPGSCLIVSKVIRNKYIENGEHKYFQPVNRIFKMHANAVIAIEKTESLIIFSLVDALGNVWIETNNLVELATAIKKFYEWSNVQQRESIKKNHDLEKFLHLVQANAKNIIPHADSRYFGNCSTRCMSTFPSIRYNEHYLFSPRNISKSDITSDDMVLVNENGYSGNRKPSVDTPVQIEIYKRFPDINYMIHGHAFFHQTAPITQHYYPCGDLREVPEIIATIESNRFDDSTEIALFAINLKNHGFLIGSHSVKTMENFLGHEIPTMMPFRKI